MLLTPPIGLMRSKSVPPVATPAVFVASNIATNASGNFNVTVTKPAGTVDGDLMVFFWFGQGGNNAQINARPSGWVNKIAGVDPNQDGAAAYFDCDVKPASSEPANYTWNLLGGSEEGFAAILTYRPAHATQLDVIAGQDLNGGGTGSSHTAPNVTTVQDQALILSMWAVNRSGVSAVTFGAVPSGMTQRVSLNSGIGRSDLGFYIAEDNTPKTPVGLYTGKVLTTGQGDVFSHAITLGIRALGT